VFRERQEGKKLLESKRGDGLGSDGGGNAAHSSLPYLWDRVTRDLVAGFQAVTQRSDYK
jgi:hypothetical protein